MHVLSSQLHNPSVFFGLLLGFQYEAMTYILTFNREKKISHCNLVRDTFMKPKWPCLLPGYGCVPNIWLKFKLFDSILCVHDHVLLYVHKIIIKLSNIGHYHTVLVHKSHENTARSGGFVTYLCPGYGIIS